VFAFRQHIHHRRRSASRSDSPRIWKRSHRLRFNFFRKDAVLDVPVYLEAGVRDYLTARAKAKGIELNDLINALLKRDIELIEIAK